MNKRMKIETEEKLLKKERAKALKNAKENFMQFIMLMRMLDAFI